MLPERLKARIEQQPGNIHRKNPQVVLRVLGELGVPIESELGRFFRVYVITFFHSHQADEQLCDLLEPTTEISDGTRFVRKVWELPERYVCLSSIQGEGAYLYDCESGCVWDFNLEKRDDFLSGKQVPEWSSFFDFLEWYLI